MQGGEVQVGQAVGAWLLGPECHHMPDMLGTIEGLLQGSEALFPCPLHDEQCKKSRQLKETIIGLDCGGSRTVGLQSLR